MDLITLQSDERDKLAEMLETASPNLQKRIRLVLYYDQGLSTRLAARQAGFSNRQARFWKHEFLQRRLEIFQKQAKLPRSPQKKDSVTWDYSKILSKPGILPEDLMSDAGKKILSFFFQEMMLHEAGTILGEDTEELHDMRVATRRLRAAFNLFGIFFNPKAIAPFEQALKNTGKSLGEVRDLDVSIEKLDLYCQNLSKDQLIGLAPLRDQWVSSQGRARTKLISNLNSQNYLDFKENFTVFLKTPSIGLLASDKRIPLQTTVRYQAPTLIYTRLAGVMAFEAVLESATYAQLHALRIEFKKLRYTLEFFKEILGEESAGIINHIKDIQDHLGDLNDSHVACQTITHFLKKWDKRQNTYLLIDRLNSEPVVNYLAYLYSKRYQLMISFPEKWQQFSHPDIRQNLAKAVASL